MSSNRSDGRPTTTLRWWWVASVALIVAGLLVIVLAPRGPAQGPSLPNPIGQTSVTPTDLGATSSTTTTKPTASGPTSGSTPSTSGTSMAAGVVSASFASYAVPASGSPSKAGDSLVSSTVRSPHAVVKSPRPVLRSRPVHLSIPALGVSVGVGVLGLNKDRTVEVPSNFAQPGWYKFGPTPGQIGSSVILGHVDSYRGPAVFFRIGKLHLGDHVIVREANKQTFTFKVIGVRMYSKTKFPDYLVYGPRPYAALQLVTCGGVFDHRTGSYLSNIVVYTALVK